MRGKGTVEPLLLSRETKFPQDVSPERLALTYKDVRDRTVELCRPLQIEDYVVQSMPEASPVKWHLAHTSWFFERFVLRQASPSYKPYHQCYDFLFNSYYEKIGPRQARAERGLLSRPTVEEIYAFRREVDKHILDLLGQNNGRDTAKFCHLILLGINHEQQHQELILTDLLNLFAQNPLKPCYLKAKDKANDKKHSAREKSSWWTHPEGIYLIGHAGSSFAFDNESPRHKKYLSQFSLATRLVTCGEYLEFMQSAGYKRPEFWLSDGYDLAVKENWQAPLYWEEHEGKWFCHSLCGLRPVVLSEPVCHVSYYEADAYARFASARLPSEAEWEVVASEMPVAGNFAESKWYHPLAAEGKGQPCDQMFGDVWEWTQSAYAPYPGFRTLAGLASEYNGKFMCNQFVLRGGSCATPKSHIRTTYRNFFTPGSRWQFTGIRLAKDNL